ncbi:hypothetical protein [Polyangium spumosum]|uniref:Uncharacterized protein n=1 Tax=Polyangium spumosum TaxID=889282 RepID=A0A6N7PU61_9BACT|nr:hypothetical protein [Polyangium spumosum]MRG95772.1 hypothetical protein [Polyangium spumosum]
MKTKKNAPPPANDNADQPMGEGSPDERPSEERTGRHPDRRPKYPLVDPGLRPKPIPFRKVPHVHRR